MKTTLKSPRKNRHGAILSFAVSEGLRGVTSSTQVMRIMGESELADVHEFLDNYDYDKIGDDDYLVYLEFLDEFGELNDKVYLDDDERESIVDSSIRISSALFSMFIALGLGLFLGLGEGVYYGSKEKAVKYAFIGAGISIVIGFLSGFLAQFIYSEMLTDDASSFTSAVIRGLGWQHTHPGYGIFLSNHDLFIQENFFNLPFQTAYVIDPKQSVQGRSKRFTALLLAVFLIFTAVSAVLFYKITTQNSVIASLQEELANKSIPTGELEKIEYLIMQASGQQKTIEEQDFAIKALNEQLSSIDKNVSGKTIADHF